MGARARYYNVLPYARQQNIWIIEAGGKRTVYGDGANNPYDAFKFQSLSDPSLAVAVRHHFGPTSTVEEVAAPKPGCFYPRIYRPGVPLLSKSHRLHRDGSVHAARVLFRRLAQVFEYIEPRGANNLKTYGHETRNLLLLACNEAESAWTAILRENGYPKGKASWNVSDYQKLAAPMRLPEWTVELVGHPHVKAITPFASWSSSPALEWYRDYNKVKHDRESEFKRATLVACVTALAGVFVMVTAQFGTWALAGAGMRPEELQSYNLEERAAVDTFRIVKAPAWSLGEHYAPPYLVGRTEKQWRSTRFFRP